MAHGELWAALQHRLTRACFRDPSVGSERWPVREIQEEGLEILSNGFNG
jgi:hypothetical protein